MGPTHFLSKSLERLKTELRLHVLACNIQRLIAILGIADMLHAIKVFFHLRRLKAALLAIEVAFRSGGRLKRYEAVKRVKTRHAGLCFFLI